MAMEHSSTAARRRCHRAPAICCLAVAVVLACGGESKESPAAPPSPDPTPVRIIDAHAHAFNLRHLPVRGILYRFGVPDPLATRTAAWLIEKTDDYESGMLSAKAAAEFAERNEQDPLELLEERVGKDIETALGEAAAEQLYDYVEAEVLREQDQLEIREFRKGVEPGRLDPDEQPILSDFLAAEAERADLTTLRKSPEELRSFIRGKGVFRLILGVLKKALSVLGMPVEFYRMVNILTLSEGEVLDHYRQHEYPRVDLFIHHMMRLDAVYDGELTVPVEEQLQRARELQELPGSAHRFFVAYDPFQFDPEFSDLQNGLAAGAIGVKFYPPSGYRPHLMAIPGPPHRPWRYPDSAWRAVKRQYKRRYADIKSPEMVEKWTSAGIPDYAELTADEALDAINMRFFRRAQDDGMVLFSHHTNEGFQAWREYGREMAAPCFWWDVLEELPDLRLILAHSGGGEGWFGNEEQWQGSFARQAFNLCVAFENVHCDFGYLDEVRTKAGRKELGKKLRELGGTDPGAAQELESMTSCDCAQRQVPRRYDIREKILYGSDWMMSVRVRGHRKFIDDFEKVFVDDLAPWRDEFFCRNAKRALRLDEYSCEPEAPSGAS